MASDPRNLDSQIDGRVARTARTRSAIVDGLFELVGEGILRPTAQEVAARAEVGIRTVFRHFSDMESLYVELDARLKAEMCSCLRGKEPSGSLEDRVRGLIQQRVEMFELISPYKRATDLLRWESVFLTGAHRQMLREQRAHLFQWLPELEDASDDVKQAADLVASFASWTRLRLDQRLGVERAVAAVERSVLALLGVGA